jgi:hypothetical protein
MSHKVCFAWRSWQKYRLSPAKDENRLLHALNAPRWVGDGDRTRDIQVHNLVSSWRSWMHGEWKRFARDSMRLEVTSWPPCDLSSVPWEGSPEASSVYQNVTPASMERLFELSHRRHSALSRVANRS